MHFYEQIYLQVIYQHDTQNETYYVYHMISLFVSKLPVNWFVQVWDYALSTVWLWASLLLKASLIHTVTPDNWDSIPKLNKLSPVY